MGSETVHDSEHAKNKHGVPLEFDPDFNGPIKNRSCTDILCLIIFLIFLIAWIIVAGVAFKYGNPSKLILPTDSDHNVCGEGEFENKTFLFFFDITKCASVTTLIDGCKTPQVCVEECPSENFLSWVDPISDKKLKDISEDDRKKKIFCKYDVDTEKTVKELVKSNECADYVLKSDAVVSRCVPFVSAFKDVATVFEQSNVTADLLKEGSGYITKIFDLRQVGDKLLDDLKNSWKIIALGLALATIISFLWIVLMRWLAWIMLWISMFLVIGILCVGCWYSFNRYNDIKQGNEPTTDFKFTSLSTYGKQSNTWMILGIVLAVIIVILLLIILFLRNRIRLAIALVEESSKAVGSIMTSLIFPIIPFILQLGVLAFGVAVSIYIASSALPKNIVVSLPSDCDCQPYKLGSECSDEEDFNATCQSICPKAKCLFLEYQTNHLITGAQILNLFGLFWGVCFVVALGQMVLAGSFATWYWTVDKKNGPTFIISASFYRTLRYHMGSLAFGSLLVAIVKMIRAFLEYVDQKLKEYTDNPVAKCIMCCLKCCFWCLENFIKFINRNAYIMISIYGKNFCTSARNAFMLLMRNIIRVVVLDKVTDFLLFLGKLAIVGFVGALSFLFVSGKLKGSEYVIERLNYIYFPIVIICLGSYIIASCFFSVYSMAVDTLFLCFLEDCEMNDGSQEKPYRMSKNLMKILGKKNAKFVDPNKI